MKTIAFQIEFRPALPVVFGAKDYREFRTTIEEMDRILTTTGIEHRMLVQYFKSSEMQEIPHRNKYLATNP